MTDFKDKERAEEAKFALDQATEFKVLARRNKLLGLWAADVMGLTGDDAEAYAKTVILADLEEPGEEDVFRKVRGDFDSRAIQRSDKDIRVQMSELMSVARTQVLNEAAET